MKSFLQFLIEDVDLEQQSKLLDRKNRLSNLISKAKEGTRSFDVTKLEQRLKEIEAKISEPSLIDFNMALLECSLEFEFYFKDNDHIDDKEASYKKLKNHIEKHFPSSFKGKKGQTTYSIAKNNINVATKYHGIKKVGKDDEWFIEFDSSLKNRMNGVPVEVVTPWFPAIKLKEVITHFKQQVYDVLKGKTDETTSMHISFRIKTDKAGGERKYTISPIKLLLLIDQKKLLRTFDRIRSEYASPFEFEAVIRRNFDTPRWNTKILKQAEKDIVQLDNYRSKYHAISFKDYIPSQKFWRIEVRGIGDAYLTDRNIQKVLATCDTLVEDFAKAIDLEVPDAKGKKKIQNIIRSSIPTFKSGNDAFIYGREHGPSIAVEDYLFNNLHNTAENTLASYQSLIYYLIDIKKKINYETLKRVFSSENIAIIGKYMYDDQAISLFETVPRADIIKFNTYLLDLIENDTHKFTVIQTILDVYIAHVMNYRWIEFEQKVMDSLERHVSSTTDQNKWVELLIKNYTSKYLKNLNEWKEFKDYLNKHPGLYVKY